MQFKRSSNEIQITAKHLEDKYPQLCDKPEKEGVPPASIIYKYIHCQYCLKHSTRVRKIMNSIFFKQVPFYKNG